MKAHILPKSLYTYKSVCSTIKPGSAKKINNTYTVAGATPRSGAPNPMLAQWIVLHSDRLATPAVVFGPLWTILGGTKEMQVGRVSEGKVHYK